MNNKIKIGVYASTGKSVGLGHLKRCLSIAKELSIQGCEIRFLVDDFLYSGLIIESGFQFTCIHNIQDHFRAIILDKYGVNDSYLQEIKKYCDFLVRLDDASPEIKNDYLSDVIINGNPYGNTVFYEGNVRPNCHLLLGSNFIPMDRKFCEIRKKYGLRNRLSTILITFGASDKMIYPKNITKTIASTFPDLQILLLNGIGIKDEIDIDLPNVKFLPFLNDLEPVLLESDLVICSASSTCWQLNSVGIPYITFLTADNQLKSFEFIRENSLGITLSYDSIKDGMLINEIKNLTFEKKTAISSIGMAKINCEGARRIAVNLIQILS